MIAAFSGAWISCRYVINDLALNTIRWFSISCRRICVNQGLEKSFRGL